MAPSDDPGPLLLQSTHETGDDVFVRRVTTSGEVYTRARLNGESRPWQARERLPADALATLRDEIAASGLLDLPREHHPSAHVIGGTTITWEADLDGRRNTVVLHGAPEVSVDAVTRVTEALEDALVAADV